MSRREPHDLSQARQTDGAKVFWKSLADKAEPRGRFTKSAPRRSSRYGLDEAKATAALNTTAKPSSWSKLRKSKARPAATVRQSGPDVASVFGRPARLHVLRRRLGRARRRRLRAPPDREDHALREGARAGAPRRLALLRFGHPDARRRDGRPRREPRRPSVEDRRQQVPPLEQRRDRPLDASRALRPLRSRSRHDADEGPASVGGRFLRATTRRSTWPDFDQAFNDILRTAQARTAAGASAILYEAGRRRRRSSASSRRGAEEVPEGAARGVVGRARRQRPRRLPDRVRSGRQRRPSARASEGHPRARLRLPRHRDRLRPRDPRVRGGAEAPARPCRHDEPPLRRRALVHDDGHERRSPPPPRGAGHRGLPRRAREGAEARPRGDHRRAEQRRREGSRTSGSRPSRRTSSRPARRASSSSAPDSRHVSTRSPMRSTRRSATSVTR